MKGAVKIGDKRTFLREVVEEDIAIFESGKVHNVLSTFALCRDAEWTCRLFVLDMKAEDEEGIGTSVEIKHLAPAFIGEQIIYSSLIEEINGHEVICSFKALVGERLIAEGKTGQKILKREKIERIFSQFH